MTEKRSCSDIQRFIFDRRHEDLSDLTRQEIAVHLEDCALCREQARKTDDMFESLEQFELAEWDDFDDDALFEDIRGQIADEEGLDSEPPKSHRTPRGEADNKVESKLQAGAAKPSDGADTKDHSTSPTRLYSAFRIAASILIGVFGVLLYQQLTERQPREAPVVRSNSSGKKARKKAVDKGATRNPVLTNVVQSKTELNSTRIYASPKAKWSTHSEKHKSIINLERGELLVEFIPVNERTLEVRTPHRSVRVTGTVFYVRAIDSGTEAGVLAGSIEVSKKRGPGGVEVEAGRAYDSGGVRDVPPELRRRVSRHLDLETHRREVTEKLSTRLAKRVQKFASAKTSAWRSTQSPQPSRPSSRTRRTRTRPTAPSGETESTAESAGQPDSEAKKEMSVHTLRQKALEARHGGRLERAAKLLNRALEKTNPGDSARADLLLNLGRLNLKDLRRPKKTEKYYDQFLTEWPDDPAAPAVRKVLCGLTNRPELSRKHDCPKKIKK